MSGGDLSGGQNWSLDIPRMRCLLIIHLEKQSIVGRIIDVGDLESRMEGQFGHCSYFFLVT